MEHEMLFSRAHAAGVMAATMCIPKPMMVISHIDPIDKNSPVEKQWTVPEGLCGFAWVVIRPANCAFAKWMKAEKGSRASYGGGMHYWISDFGQSVTRKEAYAQAFSRVLQEQGIKASAESRLD